MTDTTWRQKAEADLAKVQALFRALENAQGTPAYTVGDLAELAQLSTFAARALGNLDDLEPLKNEFDQIDEALEDALPYAEKGRELEGIDDILAASGVPKTGILFVSEKCPEAYLFYDPDSSGNHVLPLRMLEDSRGRIFQLDDQTRVDMGELGSFGFWSMKTQAHKGALDRSLDRLAGQFAVSGHPDYQYISGRGQSGIYSDQLQQDAVWGVQQYLQTDGLVQAIDALSKPATAGGQNRTAKIAHELRAFPASPEGYMNVSATFETMCGTLGDRITGFYDKASATLANWGPRLKGYLTIANQEAQEGSLNELALDAVVDRRREVARVTYVLTELSEAAERLKDAAEVYGTTYTFADMMDPPDVSGFWAASDTRIEALRDEMKDGVIRQVDDREHKLREIAQEWDIPTMRRRLLALREGYDSLTAPAMANIHNSFPEDPELEELVQGIEIEFNRLLSSTPGRDSFMSVALSYQETMDGIDRMITSIRDNDYPAAVEGLEAVNRIAGDLARAREQVQTLKRMNLPITGEALRRRVTEWERNLNSHSLDDIAEPALARARKEVADYIGLARAAHGQSRHGKSYLQDASTLARRASEALPDVLGSYANIRGQVSGMGRTVREAMKELDFKAHEALVFISTDRIDPVYTIVYPAEAGALVEKITRRLYAGPGVFWLPYNQERRTLDDIGILQGDPQGSLRVQVWEGYDLNDDLPRIRGAFGESAMIIRMPQGCRVSCGHSNLDSSAHYKRFIGMEVEGNL
ncbi:MAG: hypothetical protein ABH879_00775 [archaeon]